MGWNQPQATTNLVKPPAAPHRADVAPTAWAQTEGPWVDIANVTTLPVSGQDDDDDNTLAIDPDATGIWTPRSPPHK